MKKYLLYQVSKLSTLLFIFFTIFQLNAQSQSYTVPGTYTWTVPPCITSITVQVWGGGGGGGGAIAILRNSSDPEACAGAGGGGGGGFTTRTFAVTPGQTYTVVVGAGGAGGAGGSGTWNGGISTPPSPGGTGGNSSFTGNGQNLNATGGNGGLGAGAYNNNNPNDVNATGNGGTGGSGSGGSSNFNGGNGAAGHILNLSTDKSGAGGGAAGPGGNGGNAATGGSVGTANPPGGSGQAPGGNGANGSYHNIPSNTTKNGNAGSIYGGAGSGGLVHRENYGVQTATGGAGAHGAVLITWSAGSTPPTPTPPTPQNFCVTGAAPTVGSLLPSGAQYVWYNVAAGGTALPTNTPLSSGTYYVAETNGSCESPRATVVVTVTNTTVPTFTNPGPICSGATLTLPTTSTNTPAITGTWLPAANNTATTTYTFTPNAGQCGTTTTMTVVVNPKVTPTFNNPGPICSGDALTLPTNSTNSPAITGTWSPAVNNTATTTYTFTPTAGQCANTTTMVVTVNPKVTPTFPNPGPICSGDALTLPTNSTNSPAITGTWSPAVNNTATTTYIFTPTAGQCANTTTMAVTVNPKVTPTFTNPGPICSGDALTLPTSSTNSPAITGTWSPAVDNTTTTSYTFTPATGQCANTASMTVTVNSKADPTFNPVGPICSGDALTLPTSSTNSPAITGTWSPAVDNTTTTSYTFTPAAGQCANTASMVVTVNSLPTITVNNATICSSQSVTLTANGGVSYVWDDATTINPKSVSPTVTTSYIVTGTDANNCKNTATATVTVSVNPTPTFTNPGPICSGDALTLPLTSNEGITGTWSPIANNTATTTYTFTPDAGQCGATTSMTVTVNSKADPTFNPVGPICSGDALTLPTSSTNSPAITGTWSPAVDNTTTTSYTFTPAAGQCANTASMVVTVNPLPTITVNNATICSSQSVTLTANGGVSYVWDDATTINPKSVSPTVTTSYIVTGTDANNCKNTATATVTVSVNPTPTFTNPGPICSGDALTLPLTSNEGITGTWSPIANNTATTTYTFTPDAGQCGATTTMTVTVNPKTAPTFTQVAAICSGDALTLPTSSTNSPAITGTWSPAVNNTATTTYTFTPTTGQCASITTTMTVTVNPKVTPTFTQVAAICSGDALTLPTSSTNSPAITGAWSPAVNNTATTTYTFTPTTGQCASNTATMTVTVNPKVTPTFTQVAAICSGDALTLPTSSTNSTVITGAWSPAVNNTATTTYTFTPTAGQCAASNATMTVTVNPLPTVNAGADQITCSSSLVTLTASGATLYTWNQNLGNGATQTVSPSSTTTYTVIGVDANGCKNSDQVTVTVTSDSQATFSVDTTKGCAPSEFHFTNTTVGGDSYLWDFGDGTTSTDPNPIHVYANDTCYTVTLKVMTSAGCTLVATMNDYICVFPSPTAAFTASSYDITNIYNEVVFINKSTNATSYEWYFGDETGYSTKTNPKYTYNPEIIRNHNVVLVAKNEYGCTDTARVTIKMTEDIVFYVPNSFTPDGDEFNNIFKPVVAKGYDAFDYELLVFDRWGEIIFESHDYSIGWDGTYKGKICQDGTYVWRIIIKKRDSAVKIQKAGHVTLLR